MAYRAYIYLFQCVHKAVDAGGVNIAADDTTALNIERCVDRFV